MGLLGAIIAIVWMILAILLDPKGERPHDIALAFDRLFNATTWGSGKETLSSRAGRLEQQGEKWACVLCKFLNLLQKNHCQNSIGT